VPFRITPRQASDIASDLLEGLQAQAALAGKACDGNDLRAKIAAMLRTASTFADCSQPRAIAEPST
jgi:hypothetical protein